MVEFTFANFVVLCLWIGLTSAASVAIKGAKYEAANNRDRKLTVAD